MGPPSPPPPPPKVVLESGPTKFFQKIKMISEGILVFINCEYFYGQHFLCIAFLLPKVFSNKKLLVFTSFILEKGYTKSTKKAKKNTWKKL